MFIYESTSQGTTLHRIDSHEQRKKCGKTSPGPIPLGFTQGGLHFLLKKKNPVSTTCRSTADFIKIQPKRRLKHCKPNQPILQAKPFRPFKRSSTQVRRLTIAMVADLSYIPWDDPPLVPQDFPFPIRPKGTKVLRRCCKTNWECLAKLHE